jgi:hypothetical protein
VFHEGVNHESLGLPDVGGDCREGGSFAANCCRNRLSIRVRLVAMRAKVKDRLAKYNRCGFLSRYGYLVLSGLW